MAALSKRLVISILSLVPRWYGACAIHPTRQFLGGPMQRSILAFAMAAAIVAMGATVANGQRVVGSVKPAPARRAAPRPAPTPVQKELQRNLVLADGIRTRLPRTTDLNAAAGGFRRLELFVATVHASSNLDIPFSELKRRIVNDGMTLGQAIQDIRPKSRYWDDARRAEDDAAAAIRTSESVTLAAEKK